ncbi:MAG TPA: hypothetical protein VH079_14330 [Terriglobales bacterium]|jgi:hypothetical protein|nr:hypothetical protein [Terriglobales bacterium]
MMATKKTNYKTIPITDAKAEAVKARKSRAAKKKASRKRDK